MTQMRPIERSTGARADALVAALLVVVLIGGILGCAPAGQQPLQTQWGETEGGAWIVKQDMVAVGQPAPMPEEAGVAGVEPEAPGETRPTGVDLALFGQRWNQAVQESGAVGLRLDSFTLVYNQPFLAFGTSIGGQDWHTLVGGIDYETGDVLYLDIEFAALEFEQRPELLYETWLDSLELLVFAVTPGSGLPDASALLAEIGVRQDGAPEGEYVFEANGLEYRYTTDALRERLRISGVE